MDVVRHEGFLEESYESFEIRNLETVAAGKKFDFVFVIGLIEYFPNPRAFFRSVTEVMAAGGRLVMTAPNPASLLNLISLAARGEFSAFREASNPSSITPVLAVDVVRMLREAGLTATTVDYSGRGRVPFFRGLRYQQLLPFLRGRLWSDDFRCVAQLGSG
jgi:2-polyprenyl-3-methyl-5-hydroxy-6-metoxy-1,4-benzoquinol methylase